MNCNVAPSDMQFTGKQRDTESTLDYFWARHYSSTLGRWMSPDPSGIASADLGNPQTLNLYGYVANNPLSHIDPLGLAIQYSCSLSSPSDSSGSGSSGIGSDGSIVQTVVVNSGTQTCTSVDDGLGGPTGFLPQHPSPPTQHFDLPILIPDPCANSTLTAAGVNVRKSIAQANRRTVAGAFLGLLVSGDPISGALAGYASAVHTGGPQDYKDSQGPGTHAQRVDAGNISYGVTCQFGTHFCQFAAGAAQTISLHPDPNGTLRTGFDTPSDNSSIRQGQAMRAAGCRGSGLW